MIKHSVEIMISEKQIKSRISELGNQISEKYRKNDNKIILIGLLRGSFIFIADLCRAIKISHEVDFMTIASYGNGVVSSYNVKILKDIDEDICNKDVIIIEDIIDSGHTLHKVKDILSSRSPKSLSICTLLDKPKKREVFVNVDYIGFSIPDEFIVGYGTDYAQSYRNLPYIGKIVTTTA